MSGCEYCGADVTEGWCGCLEKGVNARSGGAIFSSETAEWSTPQKFFDALNAEFGFGLDACARPGNAKCLAFINAELEDALTKDWMWRGQRGPVWMNPPYGRTIGLWMNKARVTAIEGRTVVCLVPARTDTRWWHANVMQNETTLLPGVEVRFVKGRLKFGGAKNGAPFPSAVVIFRGVS